MASKTPSAAGSVESASNRGGGWSFPTGSRPK
jgi:hypothetical protein